MKLVAKYSLSYEQARERTDFSALWDELHDHEAAGRYIQHSENPLTQKLVFDVYEREPGDYAAGMLKPPGAWESTLSAQLRVSLVVEALRHPGKRLQGVKGSSSKP